MDLIFDVGIRSRQHDIVGMGHGGDWGGETRRFEDGHTA
jgi:hypothetical protein